MDWFRSSYVELCFLLFLKGRSIYNSESYFKLQSGRFLFFNIYLQFSKKKLEALQWVNRLQKEALFTHSFIHLLSHPFRKHALRSFKKPVTGTSLVAQWIRICLPMQGTQFWSLVEEDFTGLRATELMHHNYRAHVLWLLKPACLQPVLCNKRSQHSAKPTHRDGRVAPDHYNQGKPKQRNEDPAQPPQKDNYWPRCWGFKYA